MTKCVDCGIQINKEQGHLCDSCYKERLKKALSNECYEKRLIEKIKNDDRVVESPHSSWF